VTDQLQILLVMSQLQVFAANAEYWQKIVCRVVYFAKVTKQTTCKHYNFYCSHSNLCLSRQSDSLRCV